MLLTLACAVALLAQTPAAPPSPAATSQPNEILFKALARLRSYGTPPYVVYVIEENGAYRRVAFRGADEMMNDVALPAGATLPNARIYRAFVGPLSRSVHEAIATPSPAGTTTSPLPNATSPALAGNDLESTLKTIAVVSSRGHLYDVMTTGIETMNGHSVYHIALHPRRDPEENKIRDLWIDTSTYDVVRADYVQAPDIQIVGGEADLTVDFMTVGNYRIAASWMAVYHAPGMRTGVYRQLRVVKMAFPQTLPDWLFDEPSYAKRVREHEPDYLGDLFSKPPS